MRQLTLPALDPRAARHKRNPATTGRSRSRVSARKTPLRRRIPAWADRALWPATAGLLVMILLSVGVASWRSGGIAALGRAMLDGVVAWTGSAGIAVADVLVVGREMTPADSVLAALNVERGTPLFAFSPSAARTRLLEIGWIREARVERRLPDTIFIELTERRPAAIWQNKGAFSLIDETGAVIGSEFVGRYANLRVVVGPDAPENFAELFAALNSEPALRDRVAAAVRVGDRRWNLKLDNDMTVLLPEKGVADALHVLAQAAARGELLEREVSQIDLRLPGRMTVRLASDPVSGKHDKGV